MVQGNKATKGDYSLRFTYPGKTGTVICPQFSQTAQENWFQHLCKKYLLEAGTGVIDFTAKPECSGKSQT